MEGRNYQRNNTRNISDLKNMSLQTEKDPLNTQVCYYSGVPNAQAADWYGSEACQEPGHTAGGEQRASERSFICCSPLLTLPPEPSSHHCPRKNCRPRNWSLVPKRLGTTVITELHNSKDQGKSPKGFYKRKSLKRSCSQHYRNQNVIRFSNNFSDKLEDNEEMLSKF